MSSQRPDREREKQQMYYVGFCRVCGTGPLGLRACGNCGEVVILCDECDSVWTDADLNAEPLTAGEGDLLCQVCQSALLDSPSRWATREDLEAVDWLQDALNKQSLQLQRGSPLASDSDTREHGETG